MSTNSNPFGEEPAQRLMAQGQQNNPYGGGQEVFGDGYDANATNQAFANQDFQFQNFQHTTVNIDDPRNQRPLGSAIMQENTGDYAPQSPSLGLPTQQGAGTEQNGAPKSYHFWNVQYYAYLFNVDTPQVVQRIVRSMMPFRFSFMETIQSNPDCYGPFWIASTLIFILAASGNLSSYFSHAIASNTHVEWTADFNLIPVAAAAIYGYVFLVPLVLWGVLKYLTVPVKVLDVVCIYGYSLFIYIPISIVCIVPSSLLQWVLIFAACGLSGWFLLSNMIVPIRNASHFKKGMVIMVVLLSLHVGLALLYKLYFYAHINSTADSSSSSSDHNPTTAPTHAPTTPPTTTTAPVTTTLTPETTAEIVTTVAAAAARALMG